MKPVEQIRSASRDNYPEIYRYDCISDTGILARDVYGMSVESIDICPNISNEDEMKVRNGFMRNKLVSINKDGTFVTGLGHFEGFLDQEDTKIPGDQFHIIPINLAGTEKMFDPTRYPLLADSSRVIQIYLDKDKCFSDINDINYCKKAKFPWVK